MKLIIDIPEETYKTITADKYAIYDKMYYSIKNGTPLDNNSERAEVQAYFDGEAYGWEQGRKALIDDVKAEIKGWYWQADKQALAKDPCVVDAMVDLFIRTIDNIGKAESEDRE